MEDDGFKVCPFCKEKIRKEAIKCRFCGEWLEAVSHSKSESNEQHEILPATSQPESSQKGPEDLVAQMPEKTNDQLMAMFRQPDDWLPETLDVARAELKRRGIEPPKVHIDELKTMVVPPVTDKNSPRILYWISAALLSACGFVLFFALATGHWNEMSPAEQGKAIADITTAVFKILIVAGLIAWTVKRKGYRLLTFSIVCVIFTVIGAYYFFGARQNAQEKTAESDRQLASDLDNLQKFFQNGAIGDLPEFKPTGDADEDAVLQTWNDFYQNWTQAYRKWNTDVQALDERDVFDDLLLTNKPVLESEIHKRVVYQQSIKEIETQTTLLFDDTRKKCESLNVSEDFKRDVLKGFDRLTPQYNTMFASLIKMQSADQDFLQFLDDNFEDYELKSGKILFSSSTNVQKYAELAKNVRDALAEAKDIQMRASTNEERTKAKLLQNGQ